MAYKIRAYQAEAVAAAVVYSTGLSKKESYPKVIFGSIQSVAWDFKNFLSDFTSLVVDECHHVNIEDELNPKQL